MACFLATLKMPKRFLLGIVIWLILMPATAQQEVAAAPSGQLLASNGEQPTARPSISMARATWDTGWFQAEIFKNLLEEMGYAVGEPQTMGTLAFYLAAARGEVDLWGIGWFPSHNVFL